MLAEGIMTRSLNVAAPDTPATEVAKQMRDHDIGAMPVMEGDHIVGIVTDRDIVVRGLAARNDLAAVPVKDLMTPNPITVKPDESLVNVSKIFSHNKIRRLLVVDDADKPLGIISLGDLAAGFHNPFRVADTLEEVSSPVHHPGPH